MSTTPDLETCKCVRCGDKFLRPIGARRKICKPCWKRGDTTPVSYAHIPNQPRPWQADIDYYGQPWS